MEKADDFGAVVSQDIHEPALVGRHLNPVAIENGGNVIVETEAHQIKS
jgi:hypothetical protein